MPSIISDQEQFKSLVSPLKNINRPVYNWHAFKHSYSKDLVDIVAREFKLKKGSWVMDPFCGGGTTLLACKELGINSRGYDILPFSVFLSNVKTRGYSADILRTKRNIFNRKKAITLHIPALIEIPIAKKAFSAGVRSELTQIKQRINEIDDPFIQDFYNLGLLSILESVSNTSKSGGFLRIVKQRVQAGQVKKLYLEKIDVMLSDVEKFNASYSQKSVDTLAILGDARDKHSKRKFDAIITSPPYPNRHDYTRIYSLEMLFDFVNNNDDLKKIRYETLRSHVEAKQKYQDCSYIKPRKLTSLISKIKKNGTNNVQVLGMLEGYFEDMFLALVAMKESLKDGGKIALVVSNVRFSGVNIPVDELLLEAGEQAGLKPRAIWVARYRGNSAQQMKQYSREPSRESIVVWEK